MTPANPETPAEETAATSLRSVSRAARAMAAEPDPAEALWNLIGALREDLPIDRVGIFAFDPGARCLERMVGVDREGKRRQDGQRIPVDAAVEPMIQIARGELPYYRSDDARRDYPDVPFSPGVRAHAIIPIIASDEFLGALSVDNCFTDNPIPESLLDPLFLYAGLAALPLFAIYQKRERQRADTARREMLRELLSSVSNGKICLCDPEQIELEWPHLERAIDISRAEDVREVREAVQRIAQAAGMAEERAADLGLCASEAATNALLHGNGGAAAVVQHEGMIRVRIVDRGHGIPLEDIPSATLQAGWSRHRGTSKRTMGLGFTLIYRTADRIYLSTGPDGTTVLIEMRVSDDLVEDEDLLQWSEALSF